MEKSIIYYKFQELNFAQYFYYGLIRNMASENKSSYTLEELKILNTSFNYDEIISNLKDENCHDFIKIFSIINLEKLSSKEDARVFINHLTNHPTPIREACAIKLEEIFNIELFNDNFSKEKILNAISDINPNVCRVICNILNKYKINIQKEIIDKINILIKEIKSYEEKNKDYFIKTTKNTKNHAKNKFLFSLYWLLEALNEIYDKNYEKEIIEILKYTINFSDYTIREKTAKIMVKIESLPNEILQKAKSDVNFYVKNQVYDKINNEE